MNNNEIFEASKKYMPGGVNSPVRAYNGFDMNPPIIKQGKGVRIYDEEGNEYIDFVLAWGPLILGHCDEEVVEAISKTACNAIAFGAPTKLELEVSKFICETVDNVEMIRMVNSGTEATMSAVKLARGYTNKNKILKFSGCYHGHFEGFLVEAGSGVLTAGIAGSAGIPNETVENTLVAEYNNIESIRKVFEEQGNNIAAVIIEPVAGNMGVIVAKEEFLRNLRNLCDKYGALLIFDEVMSGFRVAYKGAQSLFDIKPDLVTYAKIMGGGLPSGAYGGKKEIMQMLSPIGPVYQAGTMSGNPIVMAAGLATLKKLYENPMIYKHIDEIGDRLEIGIKEASKENNVPVVINRAGGMFTIFFTEQGTVESYADVKKCDNDRFKRYFMHMIKKGINIPPSQFEALFLSAKHSIEDIDKFIEAFKSFEG
jgi:glutamate-1-semialdehyde-2,1-aminomutase